LGESITGEANKIGYCSRSDDRNRNRRHFFTPALRLGNGVHDENALGRCRGIFAAGIVLEEGTVGGLRSGRRGGRLLEFSRQSRLLSSLLLSLAESLRDLGSRSLHVQYPICLQRAQRAVLARVQFAIERTRVGSSRS
ncbi:hypothetical protein PFISCL1PPCAC_7553, partial [Pristionchus fissidentatus]